MTNPRVSKQEKQQRLQWAMKQIDRGVGFSELASLVAETWGCSRKRSFHKPRGKFYHPNDSWGLEGPLNHSRTSDLRDQLFADKTVCG